MSETIRWRCQACGVRRLEHDPPARSHFPKGWRVVPVVGLCCGDCALSPPAAILPDVPEQLPPSARWDTFVAGAITAGVIIGRAWQRNPWAVLTFMVAFYSLLVFRPFREPPDALSVHLGGVAILALAFCVMACIKTMRERAAEPVTRTPDAEVKHALTCDMDEDCSCGEVCSTHAYRNCEFCRPSSSVPHVVTEPAPDEEEDE